LVYRSGYGVGIIIISPNGAIFEALNRLNRKCTNNQIEYEALLFGLQIPHDMGVKHVESYGDSLLAVQQVSKVCQCLNGSLNAYLDKCLDIISCMDEFVIYHVPQEENPKTNALAQQADGYNVQKRNFHEQTKTDVWRGRGLCHGGADSTAPLQPVRPGHLVRLPPKTVENEVDDCRKPLIEYLQDPKGTIDRKG
jgi:ribonuclease HI